VLAATAFLAAGAGGGAQAPHLLGPASVTVSPDGDGVNDVVRLRVADSAGAKLRLEVYAWAGRLIGWQRIARTEPTEASTLTWRVRNVYGRTVRDGTYLVSACREGGRAAAGGSDPPRPGPAEASVARPPWLSRGCLAKPVLVRVRRLSAFVPSTRSFTPGSLVPIQLGTDKPRVTLSLERDATEQPPQRVESPVSGHRVEIRLPAGLRPGLYHVLVSDDRGNQFRAPVVVRAPFVTPPPHTALVVWPYLTWRAYNGWDGNGDGRPDSWYQFWPQRSVSLTGPLLADGVEDDHAAAEPFSRWLVAHPEARFQSITDVELGSLSASQLSRYAAIVFPGHTEYYVPSTYDRLKAYRDHGGNLIFLQANPFYRTVRVDSKHNKVVMTDFDAREGPRTDFALAGVGYDGCCFPRSHWEQYVATRSGFSKVAWLFAGTGVGPGERFGRAGIEDDRTDPALTPPDHVVAAKAVIRGNHGVVHSEMVYTRVGGGGSVFASGNYNFLRMGQRAPGGETVARVMLGNLWSKLVLGRGALPAGPIVRFALPVEPRTLDPALAADLPSLNVSRALYAGLTRFSGSGVVPDLAQSWQASQNGLVWTFKLRAGLDVTASDFRRAWLHALDPSTGSAYARAEMLNIRGARAYHSGSGSAGDVGVKAVDDRTLRVTLQHPVPWFDQQVAYPVFAPKSATGPFRLASWKHGRSIALAKNDRYWNAADVAPGRVELRFGKSGRDGMLPAGTVAPGFPWIDTSTPQAREHSLPTLAMQYLWFATRHRGLEDSSFRGLLSGAVSGKLDTLVPPTVPGYQMIRRGSGGAREGLATERPSLTLAYTTEDPTAHILVTWIKKRLAPFAAVRLQSVPTRTALMSVAGPPPRADLILLGWSGEFFDGYNFLDQFPCSSALNVAQWCDPGFDALMRRAVRTLDAKARYRIEQELESKLTGSRGAFPAAPLANPSEHVLLGPGVRGFEWSPVGFWDLRHVRRG
jgi:ABC-type transport system substrate-binding protein